MRSRKIGVSIPEEILEADAVAMENALYIRI